MERGLGGESVNVARRRISPAGPSGGAFYTGSTMVAIGRPTAGAQGVCMQGGRKKMRRRCALLYFYLPSLFFFQIKRLKK